MFCEAVDEVEADQFKEHIDYRANAHVADVQAVKEIDYRANAHVADVQAVDVEVLEVQSGGPKGGGTRPLNCQGATVDWQVMLWETLCLIEANTIKYSMLRSLWILESNLWVFLLLILPLVLL